mmetsp:Transcript_18528/g.58828  ORF Transcript_18528/g.58828 Transcript_18528/m.58828 type:complete len:146 (+) Transcript_18528:767-1204(+)
MWAGPAPAEEAKDTTSAASVRAVWRRTHRARTSSSSKEKPWPGHRQPFGGGPGTGASSTVPASSGTSTPLQGRAGPPMVQGMLQGSCSLPLLPTELRGVRDEYYGGDELFLHEDVLYSSNPQLFPLRAGNGKLFPTKSLKPIAAC